MCVAQVVQPQVNPDSTIAQELYIIQRSVQRCVQVSYTLTKWYQEPDQRISISEEALGSFGKSQTYRFDSLLKISRGCANYLLSAEDRYRGRGYDRGQEAEQKQVEI
ncbi:hypothetical protein Tco_1046054, partial [Tanacetum coccineum]